MSATGTMLLVTKLVARLVASAAATRIREDVEVAGQAPAQGTDCRFTSRVAVPPAAVTVPKSQVMPEVALLWPFTHVMFVGVTVLMASLLRSNCRSRVVLCASWAGSLLVTVMT